MFHSSPCMLVMQEGKLTGSEVRDLLYQRVALLLCLGRKLAGLVGNIVANLRSLLRGVVGNVLSVLGDVVGGLVCSGICDIVAEVCMCGVFEVNMTSKRLVLVVVSEKKTRRDKKEYMYLWQWRIGEAGRTDWPTGTQLSTAERARSEQRRQQRKHV